MQDMLPLDRPAKEPFISPLQLKQYKYETATWKRVLSFLMDENVCQKNRLSEILKDSFDKNLLEEIESFQNKFLADDELIILLKTNIIELESLLGVEMVKNSTSMNDLQRSFKKLRNQVASAERQFGKLKSSFNYYLSTSM